MPTPNDLPRKTTDRTQVDFVARAEARKQAALDAMNVPVADAETPVSNPTHDAAMNVTTQQYETTDGQRTVRRKAAVELTNDQIRNMVKDGSLSLRKYLRAIGVNYDRYTDRATGRSWMKVPTDRLVAAENGIMRPPVTATDD